LVGKNVEAMEKAACFWLDADLKGRWKETAQPLIWRFIG